MASPIKSKVSWLIFSIALWTLIYGQEDSLKGALNAIDRRQRDLSEYDETEYGYSIERPKDLAFLKTSVGYSSELEAASEDSERAATPALYNERSPERHQPHNS